MCGIAGFIDFKQRSSVEILGGMTDAVQHRGPDGSGYKLFETGSAQVGLGHRRLSIIDLSEAGSQPMQYKHFWISFNGEIYNYAEIKKELEGKGHVFRSHSDTEVILHAFEEWGENMLHRFIGMFAFVIYDEEKRKLTCFRDRAGVKPFYYYFDGELFLFGSELKSFHTHPFFKKEINRQAVFQFIQYGYIMAPLSIFKNASKLQPGHILVFDISNKRHSIEKYWDVCDAYCKPQLNITEDEAIREADRLLHSSCEYRMVADVPVGVFLSGGYDSSAVTALLQKDRTEKIRTFTIGFHEQSHNEAEHAKKVAEYLGTDHTEYYCTTEEAQRIIPDICFYCDEPLGDSSIIPTMLVSQLARKKVTVALSADAGDETFAGYPKHVSSLDVYAKLNRIPKPLRRSAGRIVAMMPNTVGKLTEQRGAFALKKKRLSSLLDSEVFSSIAVMDVLLSQNYSNTQMQSLMSQETQSPGDIASALNAASGNIKYPLNQLLAADYKTYMVDDILAKVDRATMSVSLEGREPLLDHRIIEFVAQLPAHLKLNKNTKKYLLKKIVHKYVPEELMERPKMGFSVPIYQWLRNELRFYEEQYMNKQRFEAHGLFQYEEVEKIKNEFFAGNRHYDTLYWYLLVFQMWYEKWVK